MSLRQSRILRIDASVRHDGSVTRKLTDEVVAHLNQQSSLNVTHRDLTSGIPFVSQGWIDGESQQRQDSDVLIEEIKHADIVVVGLPMYNFGAPAVFKAWFDQVALAKRTFEYVDGWPQGLLRDRPVVFAIASDGVRLGSEVDHLTPWLRTAFGMLGLTDLRFIAADGILTDKSRLASAISDIPKICPAGENAIELSAI